MSSEQYATGDRVFSVTQSGASEWQITDGNGASGYIIGRQSDTYPFAFDVDDSGAVGMVEGSDLWAAVRAFADATRTVEATQEGCEIASRWQSSGTVGAVLAQFATTGKARLDLLTDDAERTKVTDPASLAEMENLLTADHGYGETLTVKALVLADLAASGVDSVAECAARVFDVIASAHPHLITDAASARDAFCDIWAVWSDES